MIYFKYFFKNIFVIYISFLFSVACYSNANVTDITVKIKKCAACHTNTGNSIMVAWPKIAEQHSDYLFKQLLEYKKGKDGNRFDPTMLGMLQGITEIDMKDMSIYFSKQVLERTKIKNKKNDLILGKILYLYGDVEKNIVACVGCHGIDGMGNSLANFPVLKWQHKDYLITQLKKFKMYDRSNDVNSIMRDITSNMTENQMIALASYISEI